jgi:hypothetical protein
MNVRSLVKEMTVGSIVVTASQRQGDPLWPEELSEGATLVRPKLQHTVVAKRRF